MKAPAAASTDRRSVEAPALEPLEDRLLLAADPAFASPLADYYVLTEDGPLTIGIDGFHDEDPLAISVSIAGEETGVTAQVYDYTSGNRYALLHFDNADGDQIGSVLVQLFEDRSPTATERFITLATHYFDEFGNAVAADEDNPAFYTDVVLHRVISEFMLQTGDAAVGDGTGGSPLPNFHGEFDPSLSFAGRGVLGMANAGPGTNNSQFFITDVPTPWLDGDHPIFGQVISGWDVYQTLINVPVGDNHRPVNPPVLREVEIIDSHQDGTVTLIADDDFIEPVEVTITLTDGDGGQVSQTITLVPAGDITEEPVVQSIADLALSPGDAREREVVVDYAGAAPLSVTAWSNYDGAGEIGLTVVEPAEGGDPYTVLIDLPAGYDGRAFSIAVGATLAGYGNLTPSVERFSLSLGERPTIADPGATRVQPGVDAVIELTITDDDTDSFVVTAEADHDDAVVTVDPDTYELTVTAPADWIGTFEVTVTAVESDFAEFTGLAGGTRTFTVAALGDAPVIGLDAPILYVRGGDIFTFDAGITDDSGLELAVELTSRINSPTFSYVRVDPVEDEDTGEVLGYEITVDLRGLPGNFSGSFEAVLNAVEADYADMLDGTTFTFHVVARNDYDPAILGYVVPDQPVEVVAVAGKLLFVGTDKALEIYDVSDPLQPELLDTHGTTRKITDIVVGGDVAYIGTYGAAYGTWVYEGGKLISLDVSDPTDITLLDSITTQDLVHDLEIVGNLVFVANGASGIGVYNIADPENITATRATFTGGVLGGAAGMAVHGDLLYVADRAAGVVTVNIANPQHPQIVHRTNTNVWNYRGTPERVVVQDTMLYVVDSTTGLFAFDLANSAAPRRVGWLGWPSDTLTVRGNLAVVSMGGFQRFVDISDPRALMVLHSQFAPGWAGQAALVDGGLAYVPHGAEGVMILDVQELAQTIGVAQRRTVYDEAGTPVTISIAGGGSVRVHKDEATGAIDRLDIIGATTRTRVVITTPRGATTTIGDIHVYGDINVINASAVTLTGNLIVEGGARLITLGDVGGPARVEQLIRIDGPDVLTVRDAVSLTLGRVSDLRIVSAIPIQSLRAVEWLDDESEWDDEDWADSGYSEADAVIAPSLGALRITGARGGPAGDFQADLILNEHGAAPTAVTLGSAVIAGEIAEAAWTIYGQVGRNVPVPAEGDDWVLNIDGSVRPTTVYTSRIFTLADGTTVTIAIAGGGTLRVIPDETGDYDVAAMEISDATARTRVTVRSRGRAVTVGEIRSDATLAAIIAPDVTLADDLTVEGDLGLLHLGDVAGDAVEQRTITIEGDGVLNPRSGVTITLGRVTDLNLTSALPIRALTVDAWIDTDGSPADSVVAPAIGRLVSRGDFQADLTLNEDGNAPTEIVLASTMVAGQVSGATWSIYGAVGRTVATLEDGGDWTLEVDDSFRPATVYNRRTFDLGGGRTLVLTIAGGGTLRVTPDEAGEVDIASILVDNATNRTRITASVLGGGATLSTFTAESDLAAIVAGDLTLTGDLTVAGTLGTLVLGDVGGDTRVEQVIRIAGRPANPRATVAITLGSVTDLRIHSAMPIRTLTAVEWLDDESEWDDETWADSEYSEVDAIIAPWLGRLVVRPGRGQTGGDFQADLDLNGDYDAGTWTVLGSVLIEGEISDGVWAVTYGDAGPIVAGAAADSWILDVDGSARAVTARGDLGGSLTADWFGSITAAGTLTAEINAFDANPRGVSLGLLRADKVHAAELDLHGGLQSTAVGEWVGGSILADWLGSVSARPARGSDATGAFSAHMAITGDVGIVNIGGDASGSWAAVSYRAIAVGGDANELYVYADADTWERTPGVGRFTVNGRMTDSRLLAAGHIGTVAVGAMTGSDIYAGYVAFALDTVTGLPGEAFMTNTTVFDRNGSIRGVTVRGLRDDGGDYEDSYVDSAIAAAQLGAVNLAYAATDPAGDPFGVMTRSLNSYSYRDADGRTTWSSRFPGEPDAIDNLVIRIV